MPSVELSSPGAPPRYRDRMADIEQQLIDGYKERTSEPLADLAYWLGYNAWWIIPLALVAIFAVRAVLMNRRGD